MTQGGTLGAYRFYIESTFVALHRQTSNTLRHFLFDLAAALGFDATTQPPVLVYSRRTPSGNLTASRYCYKHLHVFHKSMQDESFQVRARGQHDGSGEFELASQSPNKPHVWRHHNQAVFPP